MKRYTLAVESFGTDLSETTSVTLILNKDFSFKISGVDAGPSVEKTWNDDDYEWWYELDSEATATLFFQLLIQQFPDIGRSAKSFKAFCSDKNIPLSFSSWT